MARFLFASVPLIGHVNPALPIVQELIDRGHEVGWYTGRYFQRIIEATGAQFFPRKVAYDFDAINIDCIFPERRHLRGRASLKFDVKHLFLDSIPGHRTDLMQILNHFPADAIITDNAFFGMETFHEHLPCGWAAYGVSCLHYHSNDTAPFGSGFQPYHSAFGRIRNRVLNYIAERIVARDIMKYYDNIRAGLDLEYSPHYLANIIVNEADLYIQPSIPAFEYPRNDLPDTVHFVGAFLPKPPQLLTLPPWWNDLQANRPIVHVTQGTLSTNFTDLLIPSLQALAKEDCLVIASTGGKPIDSIGLTDIPDNVRLAPFIPYHHLLPKVDAMVTNGGYGGVQQALSYGVPLIAAGNTEEKPEVCARIHWSGAGINLKTHRPTPNKLKAAIRKVLEVPGFKKNAERLKQHYQQHDPPKRSADLLEQLAVLKRPILRNNQIQQCA